VVVRHDGNRMLCGVEQNLMSLQLHIAVKFNAMVYWRWERMNVPLELDEHIVWFVPTNAAHADSVVNFLHREMSTIVRDKEPASKADFESGLPATWPGRRVTIARCAPTPPYENRREREARLLEVLNTFCEKPNQTKSSKAQRTRK